MKRFLLTGLMILGLGQLVSYAQSGGSYRDDIYYSSEDAQKDAESYKKKQQAQKEREEKEREEYANRNSDENNTSGDEYSTANPNYDSDGEYVDYDDDDYYYASRINRFNNPYYGFGYYTPFYDPFWYDPWYGYGWGPRSGMIVSVGWGNPYWGWSPWYGYGSPGYYSAWGYPYYGYGYGGYGNGYYNGYYNGFYDGYYAGGYNNYGNYRRTTYGPRSSLATGSPRSVLREGNPSSVNNTPQINTNPRKRMSQTGIGSGETERAVRSENVRTPDRSMPNSDPRAVSPRNERIERAERNMQIQEPAPQRSRVFGGNRQASPMPEVRQQQAMPEQPVYRSQPRSEQPSYQAPRYERQSTPSYSPRSGGSGSYSSPGGSGGGRRR